MADRDPRASGPQQRLTPRVARRSARHANEQHDPVSALTGDYLYGDRELLRRYRDAERDEHRRFAAQYEWEHGDFGRAIALTDYDRFDQDLTRSAQGRNQFEHPAPQRPRRAHHRNSGMPPGERSDRRIYDEVCQRLREDGRIDSSEVTVAVKSGEVLLRGQIRSRAAKRQAAYLAQAVRGVRHVFNDIRVSDEPRTLARVRPG